MTRLRLLFTAPRSLRLAYARLAFAGFLLTLYTDGWGRWLFFAVALWDLWDWWRFRRAEKERAGRC